MHKFCDHKRNEKHAKMKKTTKKVGKTLRGEMGERVKKSKIATNTFNENPCGVLTKTFQVGSNRAGNVFPEPFKG